MRCRLALGKRPVYFLGRRRHIEHLVFGIFLERRRLDGIAPDVSVPASWALMHGYVKASNDDRLITCRHTGWSVPSTSGSSRDVIRPGPCDSL